MGIKGCGAPHLLVNMWQRILENLEDCRAASLLLSVEYAKVLNRISYQHCLAAFARKGASTSVLRLIVTFLTNPAMSVRVG